MGAGVNCLHLSGTPVRKLLSIAQAFKPCSSAGPAGVAPLPALHSHGLALCSSPPVCVKIILRKQLAEVRSCWLDFKLPLAAIREGG